MDTIEKISGQVMRQLPESLQRNLEAIQERGELSVYKGGLTTPCVIKNVARIKNAFPNLPEGFYKVLSERITENGFNDGRFTDAVNNVIDTCIYPSPTIGQFISFDKRVKVYKYPEMVKMVEDGDPKAFERYKRILIEGYPEAVWIHVNDVAKYNITSK